MTNQEKQEIIDAVLEAISQSTLTIEQLTAASAVSDADSFELSGGRKVTFGTILEAIRGVFATVSALDNLRIDEAAKNRLQDAAIATNTTKIESNTAQILRNTGQAVFLGTPLINTTDAAITMSGVTVAAKSVYFPASNAVVNGSTSVYHPAAQTVALTAENLSWSLWVVLFDKSNATFEAIPSSQFSGNLNANKYFYAVIRRGSAGASGVGVLRINSFAYKLNGNTEYRQEMPSDLPTIVAGHTSTLASLGTAIAGLQADVLASQHEAFLAAGNNGGITINTQVPKTDPMPDNPQPSDYKVTITIRGTVYVNGSYTSYNRYANTPRTIEYSSYGIQFLLFDTAADGGLGDFVLRAAPSMTTLGATEYLVGIFRLPIGYALEDNSGLFKLNCGSHTINGVKYLNRFAPESWQAKLISGTNIKTINGQTLLGSGDIEIGGSTGVAVSPVNRYAGYPAASEQLRVLCIGNSFTENTLRYVGQTYSSNTLVKHLLSADEQGKLFIGTLVRSAESISGWKSILEAAVVAPDAGANGWAEAKHIGSDVTGISWTNNDPTTPYASYVAQPWDVIMIQQNSGNAADWSSYAELASYIKLLRALCTNKQVTIVWNMPWATLAQPNWAANAANTLKLMESCGVGIVAPGGTIVENLKANLNATWKQYTDDQSVLHEGWSSDGAHLSYAAWSAAGSYAVGCGFWEAVIRPWCGIGVRNDTTVIDTPQSDNRDYLKQCAWCAVNNWLNVAPIKDLSI